MRKVTAGIAQIALVSVLLLAVNMASAAELPFVENEVLYRLGTDGVATREVVATDVYRILDHRQAAQRLLYVTPLADTATDAVRGGKLMLVNTATWTEQFVAANVITANLSPDGTTVALWNKDHEVHLVHADGTPLRRIGVHGSAPVFSHDGGLVAYQKLSDTSPDGAPQSLFEFAQGIAVYDVRTGRERLVTNGGTHDFAPVGFSRDLTRLYFNSTRPFDPLIGNHVASLWVVDLQTGNTRRLTNTDEKVVRSGSIVPVVSENALWSSDRTTIISSNGKEQGVWMFVLPQNSGLATASHVADGDSPQWLVPDVSIVVRTVISGKSVWRALRVR